MTGEEYLANKLQSHKCICYYPSSGPDLSNLDYFCSGKLPWSERTGGMGSAIVMSQELANADNGPDLFIHTDINFYQEFEAGFDLSAQECGINGSFSVIAFEELPTLQSPNMVCDNYAFSGRCFEYKLKLWGSEKIITLIYCLCENEYFVTKVLLAHKIAVPIIWSRNWAGGKTYGTWLANVLHQLNTAKVYTDWLCIPGKRGQPGNDAVAVNYPQLMAPAKVKLVRNEAVRWIDEGANGWVEEFDVQPI